MRTVEDFSRWTQWLKPLYFDELSVLPDTDTVRGFLKEYPKLVIAMNHGSAASPGYVHAAMFDILLKNGGSERRPMGVGWKHFYKVPVMKRFVSYVTQVDRPLDFDEFVKLFIKGDYSDLQLYPEGENCLFGNAVDMQPFMSPRFLEIAIRAKVPVLLAVHHSSEETTYPIQINQQQADLIKLIAPKTGTKLESSGLLNMPNFFAGKISELRINFQLYHPQLKLKDLPRNKTARRKKLMEEAEEVRSLMQDMVDVMKNPDAKRVGLKKRRKPAGK